MYLEQRIDELTIRVNELTLMLVNMYHDHPELCPHNWEQTVIVGNERHFHCSLCGEDKMDFGG